MEEHGYFNDIVTGKLSLAGREPIDLRLMYTCRAVAEEMKNVALRINTVTFKTGDIEDSEGFQGLLSRAGRFKQALNIVIRQRHEMFTAVLHLITPEVIEQVVSRFGAEGRCIANALSILRAGERLPQRLLPSRCLYQRRRVDSKHELPAELDQALQYTL
jgi:hypothetical protein